jgi:hypothetical protein
MHPNFFPFIGIVDYSHFKNSELVIRLSTTKVGHITVSFVSPLTENIKNMRYQICYNTDGYFVIKHASNNNGLNVYSNASNVVDIILNHCQNILGIERNSVSNYHD